MTSEQKRNLSPSRIGVKYCGGCNPGYDRGSLVARIQDALSTKIEMVSLEEAADLIIAIQGCPTACADLSPFDPSKVFHIKNEEDVKLLIEKLFEDRPV